MHQQLWGNNVEEKLYLGVREQKRLNTTALPENTQHSEERDIHAPGRIRAQNPSNRTA
jgi:hypothetical protein